ncbi:hypothetical protein ACA910_021929 [Epithemia clementina (nom. ined.)]
MMMNTVFSLLCFLLLGQSALSFAPQCLFGVRTQTLLSPSSSTTPLFMTKHVMDKAARWAAAKRPKKSRPSDINRKPVVYELTSMAKPSEYTISDAPAVPLVKPN